MDEKLLKWKLPDKEEKIGNTIHIVKSDCSMKIFGRLVDSRHILSVGRVGTSDEDIYLLFTFYQDITPKQIEIEINPDDNGNYYKLDVIDEETYRRMMNS